MATQALSEGTAVEGSTPAEEEARKFGVFGGVEVPAGIRTREVSEFLSQPAVSGMFAQTHERRVLRGLWATWHASVTAALQDGTVFAKGNDADAKQGANGRGSLDSVPLVTVAGRLRLLVVTRAGIVWAGHGS